MSTENQAIKNFSPTTYVVRGKVMFSVVSLLRFTVESGLSPPKAKDY